MSMDAGEISSLKANLILRGPDKPLRVVCPPATVRTILHDSHLFQPQEVERWVKADRVPPNTHLTTWVLQTARMEGLAYKAWGTPGGLAEVIQPSLNPEHYDPHRWVRGILY
jgi:hypothetical protein